jgi:hypothetical protein
MAELLPHSEPHPDVAGYLLGTLQDDEAQAFLGHLDGCEACRLELDQLEGLPELLTDVPDSWALPAGLEERTFVAVEAAAQRDRTGAGAIDGAQVSPITAARERSRERRRPQRLLIAVAAAAAVVIAGVATLSALRKSPAAPLATIRLISTDGGPAQGSATIRTTPAGLTIDMTVDGLAPTPVGKIYTCWLVADDDTLAHPDRVSVGSFVAYSRTVHVHWTTAADLKRFPHLGVTVEPDNGNPSHQGPKVLSGA